MSIHDYHERTKHSPHRFAAGPGYLDWDNQPDPFRTYDGAPRLLLPLGGAELDIPVGALFHRDEREPAPIDKRNVAAFFELSLGLSAWKEYQDARWALRCNPSSGNLHPTEGYAVLGETTDLPSGVFHYLSRDHLLEQRAAPDDPTDWNARLPAGGFLAALTSIHERESWKYGERAYRYCQLNAGHAVAAMAYAGAVLGWRTTLLSDPGDDLIGRLLGVAEWSDAGEVEHPDLLAWVGAPPPPDLESLKGLKQAPWCGTANILSPGRSMGWPLVDRAAEWAEKPETREEPAPLPSGEPPATTPFSGSAPTLILQRRSAQRYDGKTTLSRAACDRILETIHPARNRPLWEAFPWAPRVHPVLMVHRVEGLDPGLYALPRSADGEAALREALTGDDTLWEKKGGSLFLLKRGDFRQAGQGISCNQEIAADGVFTLGMLADYERALEEGSWWYRRLHWEAGAIGQALYLGAEAEGLRGTGIGCFFDDAFHQGLNLSDRRLQTLYHFTLGGALDDDRLKSRPPYEHLKER